MLKKKKMFTPTNLYNELNKIKDLYPNFVSSIQGKGLIAAIIFKKKIKLKYKYDFS